jgi:hypothetical protein
MPRVLDPFRFVLIAVAGWMNQHQLQIIDYLREENRVLREQLGGRRMRFNDDQRRRLAAMAKGLGRKLLAEVATIVTRDLIGMASEADCQQVRWYWAAPAGATSHGRRDRSPGGSNGARESGVGLAACGLFDQGY